MMILAACAAGFVLDLMFGDPVWLYHPVRLIGKLIGLLEKVLYKEGAENKSLFARGIFLWMVSGENQSGSVIFVGNILVLSDSGYPFFENRKHESI